MKGKLSNFVRLMIVAAVYSLGANCVHPVTPTLVTQLNLPDYMFFVMFASMAVGSLIFSPVWGKVADKYGRRVALAFTLWGYAAAQIGFCYATQGWQTVLFRFIGGAFACGTPVIIMACVIDITTEMDRAKKLSVYAAITAVASAAGFFTGGMVGLISVRTAFYAAVIILSLAGVMCLTTIDETLNEKARAVVLTSSHRSLMDLAGMKRMMTLPLALFLLGVAISMFGYTGYDNAFNYFIKREMNLGSNYNGIIKAVTGLIGLFANVYLNRWVIKHFEPNKAVSVLYVLASVSLLIIAMVTSNVPFFAVNILFYTFYSMQMPIQQALMAQGQQADYGLMSGMFNSAKSVGMITGALVAGITYEIAPRLPFFVQCFAYLAAGILTWWGYQIAVRRRRAA